MFAGTLSREPSIPAVAPFIAWTLARFLSDGISERSRTGVKGLTMVRNHAVNAGRVTRAAQRLSNPLQQKRDRRYTGL
jgi:hypothetical protein